MPLIATRAIAALALAIAIATLIIGFEQFVQLEFGATGLIAFVALSIGIKARNTLIGGIGAVILMMLLTQAG